MATKVTVPTLGESVVEATVGMWHKKEGDSVTVGDVLVELQTDKVDIEVNADITGVLVKIERQEEEDVEIGDVLAVIDETEAASADVPATNAAPAPEQPAPQNEQPQSAADNAPATPVARRMAADRGVNLSAVSGSGRGGRVTKSDIESHQAPAAASKPPQRPAPPASEASDALAAALGLQSQREERVKLTRRRRTIARNLVQAQQTAAMLTTFNEVDMHAVMELRSKRKAWFEEKFGVRLGFMSFFVKAVVAALKQFPRVNAEIDGDEMVLKNHYDIGIAVGAEDGLVVPVVRDADQLTFAEIESRIRGFGKAAQQGSLKLEDLLGGTFTITNGGVFGSMLSTPILNAPQVAILGMHNIVERPIVIDGQIVVRPIMYLALSYDHRIVDGREAVQFLYRVKELIEDPEDLLLAG